VHKGSLGSVSAAPGLPFGTETGLPGEMRSNDAVDDAQRRAHELGAAGEEKAQGIGNAQRPLLGDHASLRLGTVSAAR
jgi:hypothetical protein